MDPADTPPSPYDRNATRFGARDAVLVVLFAAALLVLFEGSSFRRSAERMDAGAERSIALAVARPAGWLADQLPLAGWSRDLTAGLSPDDDLGGVGTGFAVLNQAQGGIAPVTPDSFTPEDLGRKPAERRPLDKVLVTGDSMSQPLDAELARRLSEDGVEVVRDPRLGTGISKSLLVDWGRLAASQSKQEKADAVVVFIGANEGFPMPYDGRDVECCGPEWAAAYANRVRAMMDTYRRAGDARVYWLTLPAPRDADRQEIARAVNAAITVAAQPYRSQVRVLDTWPTFTPDGEYTDAIEIDGEETLVRESDGIHLNGEGAGVLADQLLKLMDADFER